MLEKSTVITDYGAHGANGWTLVSGYTGERSHDLSFGAVRVRIPDTHRMGRIELPSSIRIFGLRFSNEEAEPAKHFIIRGIEQTSEEEWIRTLSAATGKTALVFIHGFNTKFNDSVFRTAQIVWDLQFRGTTVLFSWPSRGEIADYDYDRDSALGSRYALLHVIDDLHQAGFDNIDIIAHSMGNLIALDALSNSASAGPPLAIVAQLIMAAPDVDRDLFVQEIPRLAQVAKGLTLYASKNDRALQLSKRVGGNIPRAGDVPPGGPIVSSSVSTIDVSAIGDELFGLNHNTFATTRNILDDIKILLDTGKPPPRLTEIRSYPEPPQKAAYFRYVP
jgi:esterase/lipase superfamily enzyme